MLLRQKCNRYPGCGRNISSSLELQTLHLVLQNRISYGYLPAFLPDLDLFDSYLLVYLDLSSIEHDLLYLPLPLLLCSPNQNQQSHQLIAVS